MERLVHPHKRWVSKKSLIALYHAYSLRKHLMSNLPVLWLGCAHEDVKVHKDLLVCNTKYCKTQRACNLWGLVQVTGQLACHQQGLTSCVWLGLRENSGPCSVFSESCAKICAVELSHTLIFQAASCKEKNERSRKVPALLPRKSLFLDLLMLQITCLKNV